MGIERNYIHQLSIAVDQLFNTLLAGYADETLSARAYRGSNKKKRWNVIMRAINMVFFWQPNHCYRAYRAEVLKRHSPAHYSEDMEE